MNASTLCLLACACLPCSALGKPPDKSKYEVCSKRTDDASMELISIRPSSAGSVGAAFDCLSVLVGFSPRRTLFSATIEAVGAEYGLALARERVGQYRTAVKLGDYDGQLVLFGPGEDLQVLPGGPFILWSERYIVMHHHPDPRSLVAVDVETGRQVLARDVRPVELDATVGADFYELNGKLLTSVARDAAADGGRTAMEVDPGRGEAHLRTLTKAEAATMKRIKWVAPLEPEKLRCRCE